MNRIAALLILLGFAPSAHATCVPRREKVLHVDLRSGAVTIVPEPPSAPPRPSPPAPLYVERREGAVVVSRAEGTGPLATFPVPAPHDWWSDVVGDLVLVGISSGDLHAVDGTTGRVLWSVHGAPPGRNAADLGGGRFSLDFPDGLHVLDAATGATRYVVPLRSAYRAHLRPLAGGRWIALSGDEAAVFAASSGKVAWRRPIHGADGGAVVGGALAVPGLEGPPGPDAPARIRLVLYDLRTGFPKRRLPLGESACGRAVVAAPLDDHTVAVTIDCEECFALLSLAPPGRPRCAA